MVNSIKKVLFLCCFSLVEVALRPCFGQVYNFKNFNVGEGLAQSQVYDICQDIDGNLWIASLGGGVCKYDGKVFETFTTKEGLLDNTVYKLLPDKKGNVWVFTPSGITKYIPPLSLADRNNSQLSAIRTAQERFISYDDKQGLAFAERYITSAVIDSKENVWVGTYNGLFMLPKVNIEETEKIGFDFTQKQNLFRKFTTREELLDTVVYSLAEDNLGNIYIGTQSGVNIMRRIRRKLSAPNMGRTVLYFEKITPQQGLTKGIIRNILKDQIGNVWFTSIHGMTKYDPIASENLGSAVLQAYTYSSDNLKAHYPTSFIQDTKGAFWLTTRGGGIFKLKIDEKLKTIGIDVNIRTHNGIPTDEVIVSFEDRESNIWFGFDGGGISKFKGRMFETITTKEGLGGNFISDIVQDKNSNFWFTTFESGITVFLNGANEKNKNEFKVFNSSTGFAFDETTDALIDKSGMCWVGTTLGCIYFDPAKLIDGNLNVKLIKVDSSGRFSYVTKIFEDSKGQIWLGGYFYGLLKFNWDDTNPKGYRVKSYNQKHGLLRNRVEDITEDSKGNLWVASTEGVSIFMNLVHDSKVPVVRNFTTEHGLIHGGVLSLYIDKKQNVWCATRGGVTMIAPPISGYESPNPSKFTIHNYTKEEGLSSDLIYLINEDENGNIWFGTNKGIDKFIIDRGSFRTYGKEEGFSGIETNHNATFKDSENNIWFGTIMGAIKYNPREEYKNREEPITEISNIRVFFKEIEIPKNQIFTYNQNYLTFDFVAKSLSVPEKVVYQWQLEGFDDDWLPVTNETRVTYSNIPPGVYTFKVKAANDDGLWNANPTSFSFTITPPFWQTWWFYSITSVFLISSIVIYIKVREKKLLKEKIILERKVLERTSELASANEELGEKNKKITQSINYAKRIQKAILPPTEFVRKYLPESFILFKPRDIVSGDFYWMEIHNDGEQILLAAADCTGHGVPGALMSIVGYNLLNQSLGEGNNSVPAEILTRLNLGLSNIFKEGFQENTVRDGMDIALCKFDLINMKIEYSGAHNPLYLIRDNKMIVYKANKFPIGRYIGQTTKDFTNHEIEIKKGDVIYLFSDGYMDQFGGPDDRKFLQYRFKDLLQEVHQLPINEQHDKLDSVLEAWKGNRKQLDDILVIGVKI